MKSTIFLLICFSSFSPLYCQLNYSVKVPDSTKTVFIAGEMTGWMPVEMDKKSENEFSLHITNATTLQEYKYLSGPDWNYTEIQSDGAGIGNRKYAVKDTVEKWKIRWDFTNNFPPAVAQGRVERYWFRSSFVDDRYIDIWLPGNYNSGKKYSVLYMHDGQMLFNASSWNGQEWNADSTLALLAAKGSIPPVIVVGIHNNGLKRFAEFFPEKAIDFIKESERTELMKRLATKPQADNYLKFLVKELKPFIDSLYSTNAGKQNTFIAGSSMGALISLYAFCEYPDVFSRAACLSTHWTGIFKSNVAIPGAINQYLLSKLPPPKGRKLYFDLGTIGIDSLYKKYQLVIDRTVRSKGYNYSSWKTIVFTGADHNENAWQSRFHIPAMFILKSWK